MMISATRATRNGPAGSASSFAVIVCCWSPDPLEPDPVAYATVVTPSAITMRARPTAPIRLRVRLPSLGTHW